MIRQIFKMFNNNPDMQSSQVEELLHKEKIRMTKTSEFRAPDRNDVMSFTYKFYFDNMARKRRFLNAVTKYPPQEWDFWVRWMDELSQLKDDNGVPQIIVEAHCLVPPDKVGRFRYIFEAFVAKELILTKE